MQGNPVFCSSSVSTSESFDMGPVTSSILRSDGTISPSGKWRTMVASGTSRRTSRTTGSRAEIERRRRKMA
jgi:hypothetical protein